MDAVKRAPTTRTLLAWGVIGILGIVCIVMGIARSAASGLLSFEAVKFTAAGSILLAIAIYKLARGVGQR
jgi:uncharacterized membrane protein